MSTPGSLSRRERQIMDILYQRGKASASEVREAMEAAPGYSAVRAMLRVLEEKGHARHQAAGLKYVYLPTVAPNKAKRPACWRGACTIIRSRTRTNRTLVSFALMVRSSLPRTCCAKHSYVGEIYEI